jgi:hypothetical protein
MEHKVDNYEVPVFHLIMVPNVLAAQYCTDSNEFSMYSRFLWFVLSRLSQPILIASKVRAYPGAEHHSSLGQALASLANIILSRGTNTLAYYEHL